MKTNNPNERVSSQIRSSIFLDTTLHPKHPKWIGAWWLGYITFGCAACVLGIPLFFFPRSLRKGHNPDKEPSDAIVSQKKSFDIVAYFKGLFVVLLATV